MNRQIGAQYFTIRKQISDMDSSKKSVGRLRKLLKLYLHYTKKQGRFGIFCVI